MIDEAKAGTQKEQAMKNIAYAWNNNGMAVGSDWAVSISDQVAAAGFGEGAEEAVKNAVRDERAQSPAQAAERIRAELAGKNASGRVLLVGYDPGSPEEFSVFEIDGDSSAPREKRVGEFGAAVWGNESDARALLGSGSKELREALADGSFPWFERARLEDVVRFLGDSTEIMDGIRERGICLAPGMTTAVSIVKGAQ